MWTTPSTWPGPPARFRVIVAYGAAERGRVSSSRSAGSVPTMSDAAPTPGRRAATAVAAIGAGGILAAVLVGVVLAPDRDEARPGTDTAAEFVTAWERWRRADVSYVEVTTRRSGERSATARVEVAQRFPDRVVRDGTQISARLNGRRIGCGPNADGATACLDNGGISPVEELRVELDRFVERTEGSSPRYRLSALGGGCYRFRLTVDEFRPPWGRRWDVCFDRATGVVRREEITRGEVVITTRRIEIERVSDSDLDLPAEPDVSVPAVSVPAAP